MKQRPLCTEIAETTVRSDSRTTVKRRDRRGTWKNEECKGWRELKHPKLLEMAKAACCELNDFLDMLLDLVHMVWNESQLGPRGVD